MRIPLFWLMHPPLQGSEWYLPIKKCEIFREGIPWVSHCPQRSQIRLRRVPTQHTHQERGDYVDQLRPGSHWCETVPHEGKLNKMKKATREQQSTAASFLQVSFLHFDRLAMSVSALSVAQATLLTRRQRGTDHFTTTGFPRLSLAVSYSIRQSGTMLWRGNSETSGSL